MIAFDASAIIALVEGIEPARAEISRLIANRDSGWVVSTISLTECFTRPKAREVADLRVAFEIFFSAAEVSLASVTAPIAARAAEIRSSIGLKTPDAIHFATALEHFADSFVTTDRGFARCVGRFGPQVHILPRSTSTP